VYRILERAVRIQHVGMGIRLFFAILINGSNDFGTVDVVVVIDIVVM
jgi:hypothetical protein